MEVDLVRTRKVVEVLKEVEGLVLQNQLTLGFNEIDTLQKQVQFLNSDSIKVWCNQKIDFIQQEIQQRADKCKQEILELFENLEYKAGEDIYQETKRALN